MLTLGLDIGGANVKAATSDGSARSVPFPLWKRPDDLCDELKKLAARLPGCSQIAVTMTGELADCFATKAEGVARILDAVEQLAEGRPIHVWTTAGRFVTPTIAKHDWQIAAAANWHAVATWAGRFTDGSAAVLIDIGSTTTDIIPLSAGRPCAQGSTDLTRLQNGELVYTGVRRTPLCAAAQSVEVENKNWPLAAELFATTLDIYLLSGEIPESPNDCDTADGRPATVACARNRVCHMFCCDETELTASQLERIVQELISIQQQTIRLALSRVLARLSAPVTQLILSGSGAFLARHVVDSIASLGAAVRVDLPRLISPQIAESAPAFAVATLLTERQ
jgi:probable H4MPT-linked C1 transfer pathway protein